MSWVERASVACALAMLIGPRVAAQQTKKDQTAQPPAATTRVSTDHLALTASASKIAVAPGDRFSLLVAVTPRPRMHVYAPGADGYRVVALKVASQPHVRAEPVAYPASEVYFFEPLNEKVPVYQKPFTLMTDVVLDVTPEAEKVLNARKTLTITGSFDYQACDDRVCFNPVTIPLTWTFTVTPTRR